MKIEINLDERSYFSSDIGYINFSKWCLGNVGLAEMIEEGKTSGMIVEF